MSCRPHYSDESCSGCSEPGPGTCPQCNADRKVCADCGFWLECGECSDPADCGCVADEEQTAQIPVESMQSLVFGATNRKAA